MPFLHFTFIYTVGMESYYGFIKIQFHTHTSENKYINIDIYINTGIISH